jgi:hypothetical protein
MLIKRQISQCIQSKIISSFVKKNCLFYNLGSSLHLMAKTTSYDNPCFLLKNCKILILGFQGLQLLTLNMFPSCYIVWVLATLPTFRRYMLPLYSIYTSETLARCPPPAGITTEDQNQYCIKFYLSLI